MAGVLMILMDVISAPGPVLGLAIPVLIVAGLWALFSRR